MSQLSDEFFEEFKSQMMQIPGVPWDNTTLASMDEQYNPQRSQRGFTKSRVGDELQKLSMIGSVSPLVKLARDRGPNIDSQRGLTIFDNPSLTESQHFTNDELKERLRKGVEEEKRKKKVLEDQLNKELRSQIAAGTIRSGIQFGEENSTSKPAEYALTTGFHLHKHFTHYSISELLGEESKGNDKERNEAVHNIFQYRRGASQFYPDICHLYTPNKLVSHYEDPIEHLKCVNCRKSLNTHMPLRFKVALSEQSISYQNSLLFFEEMLNNRDIVLLVESTSVFNTTSSNEVLDLLLQQLANNGLVTKDQNKIDLHTIESGFFKKFFIQNCPLEEKNFFEDYLENPEIESRSLKRNRTMTVDSF